MSEVITYYSYKGGVGRTMALANTAVVLAKWGHKVLTVDWDLEAPGLEHFFKEYINEKDVVKSMPGMIDILTSTEKLKWSDSIIDIQIPNYQTPIHLLTSGRRDEDYFKRVRSFDVDTFYENGGGDIIENLRNEWLENYDYVLIDSRTGITEIGGICTIQLPDTVVMLFTATNQGFDGVLDIINRASAAQQKLPYDRQKLVFLPIPSKFETNTEFILSQEWLKKFAEKLQPTYDFWLPGNVNRKEFLELTKIPYIAYFSFGEKLPVIEQGVKDPTGLGYAYETLAAMIANSLTNVDWLITNRDQYITDVNKFPSVEVETKRNNGESEKRLRNLQQKLGLGTEMVHVEKNFESILSVVNLSIVHLLKIAENSLNEIAKLFKSKNSFCEITSNGPNSYSSRTNLVNISNIIKQKSDEFYSDDINHISYFYTFSFLRKSPANNYKIELYIRVLFHDLVYEIESNFGSMKIEKLYHEVISESDAIEFSEAISLGILKEIEDNTNRK